MRLRLYRQGSLLPVGVCRWCKGIWKPQLKYPGQQPSKVGPFSTQFSLEIINAPRYGEVKMPTMDLYDGPNDPEEHLGVYKA